VADALRLHDRGQIAVGKVADLVLLDQKGKIPRVHGTLRHGHPVYWDKFMNARGVLCQETPLLNLEMEPV
jgi:cytosine/adenosine deaminase-related metal-dependent hydrolase